MKILIIARYFSPYNAIASVRLTKLAKYLQRAGHTVTVLTAQNNEKTCDPILMEDEKEIPRIIRGDNSSFYYKLYAMVYGAYKKTEGTVVSAAPVKGAEPKADRTDLLGRIKVFVRNGMFIWEQVNFTHQARRLLSVRDGDFDVILSSYGPFSSHMLGMYYKRRLPGAQWVADFRDLVQFSQDRSLAGMWARRFVRRVYRHADAVTAVSEGVLEALGVPSAIPAEIISNGYDSEDIRFVTVPEQGDGCMHLVYPGQLYAHKSDLTPVFRCLRDLVRAGEIDPARVKLDYAGPDFPQLCWQAEKYEMQDILVDHGYIDRSRSLALQRQSDILLLASWNNVGNTGIVTGKYLEYLMIGKPVLAVVSGNLAGSALKDMITEGRTGFCYEVADPQEDALREFLRKQYRTALGDLRPDFAPDRDIIARYSYAAKADSFDRLFRRMGKEKANG